MPLKLLRAAAAVTVLLAAGSAYAKPLETFPLSKVRRGQKGYGLTTMQGTKPSRFSFEVLGVNHNFLPKMDVILVKSDDPKLKLTGFWEGMSGSPLFIDGKLACAFSYGFRFNKVAIGGCTPIQYMKNEGFLQARRLRDDTTPRSPVKRAGAPGAKPDHKQAINRPLRLRQPVPKSAASLAEWLKVAPKGNVDSALASLGPNRAPWLMRAPLPPAPVEPDAANDIGMHPAAVPLAMSGFSAPAFEKAKTIMSRYPIHPMAVGGTGWADEGPTKFAVGQPISVQLVRGDMSADATGTVSFMDGNRVLAFGHPLFQAGEIYAPVAAAEVHTVIPSAMSAFIVSSPLRELGTLVQDRQATIMANTALKTRMIPVDISVQSPDPGQSGSFHVQVLDNRFFTAALTGLSAMSAVSYYLPDRDDATVLIDSTVKLRGYEPLRFTDYLYSRQGAGGVIGGARGLRALVPLLMNPFAPVDIQRVALKIRISYNTNYGVIEDLRLPTNELPPGKRTYVDVVMRRYDGANIVKRVPFDVPKSLAGSIVKLQVTAGDSVAPDSAPPKDLRDLVGALRKLLPGNVFAVTLYTAYEGTAIDGKIVHDLPASVLDQLHTGGGTQRTSPYHIISRSVFPAHRVIEGGKSTLVKVADLPK